MIAGAAGPSPSPPARPNPMTRDTLPDFDAGGSLPPGDYRLTLAELRSSPLVVGPPGRPGWDVAWRSQLVDNLEYLAGQLWQVGVSDIFIAGSFVEGKDHPADVDGYFVCERSAYKSRALHRALNALEPNQAWTWRQEHRRPDDAGHWKLPLWHHYRVELLPYYGQSRTGFVDRNGEDVDYPTFFRHGRDDRPKGVVALRPG